MVVAGGWGGSRLSEFQLFSLLECQRGLGNAGRVELTASKGVIFEVEVGVKSVQIQKCDVGAATFCCDERSGITTEFCMQLAHRKFAMCMRRRLVRVEVHRDFFLNVVSD